MSRKPELTLTQAEEPLKEVELAGHPCYFAPLERGAVRDWLQYSFKTGDLMLVHRTRYVAEVRYDGEQLHELEVEYYEPEFPNAVLRLHLLMADTGDAYVMRRWTQYYPNDTAESVASEGDDLPKRLQAGASWSRRSRFGKQQGENRYQVGDTYLLDSCGEKQVRCLELVQQAGEMLNAYYIDEDGVCMLQRRFRQASNGSADAASSAGGVAGRQGDVPSTTVNGVPYRALTDAVPNSLVFAKHWG